MLTPVANNPVRQPRESSAPLRVALVNNMPDSAFADTERQFRNAVRAGAGADVELELHTMPGLARSARVTAEIRTRYRGLDELWQSPPDALIVTGTEPVQAQLQYEPYWPELSQLLQWAAESVPTTLLSCLAAHASLLIFDGLVRKPLPAKYSGVYPGAVDASGGRLAAGLPAMVSVPHSRVNDIPEQAMVDSGYAMVIGDAEGGPGWSVAARMQGSSMFVLCQGHLEYSTESLLREYRRDVRRYLFGRGAFAYPKLPTGYLTPAAVARLEKLKTLATTTDTDPSDLYASFPYAEVEAGLENAWSDSSVRFYRNWLESAVATKQAPPRATRTKH
jgi:homoserine O-succinyltransferase